MPIELRTSTLEFRHGKIEVTSQAQGSDLESAGRRLDAFMRTVISAVNCGLIPALEKYIRQNKEWEESPRGVDNFTREYTTKTLRLVFGVQIHVDLSVDLPDEDIELLLHDHLTVLCGSALAIAATCSLDELDHLGSIEDLFDADKGAFRRGTSPLWEAGKAVRAVIVHKLMKRHY